MGTVVLPADVRLEDGSVAGPATPRSLWADHEELIVLQDSVACRLRKSW
jgi:hypothetical protein